MIEKKILIWGKQERYGRYDRALRAEGGTPCFSEELTEAEACAGLVLPGGGDLEPWRYGQVNTASRNLEPERDAAELELIRRFCAAGKPILGICRGMQTINVAFGGTLRQDLPGHLGSDGRDRLHSVYTAPSGLGMLYGEGLVVVNSAHHQAVDRLGNGLRAVQWAMDGTIEAIEHTDLPILGVQWHPERLEYTVGGRIFQHFLMCCQNE